MSHAHQYKHATMCYQEWKGCYLFTKREYSVRNILRKNPEKVGDLGEELRKMVSFHFPVA
ncbi:hypothetical protein DGMP_02080 [Desulfomarina profundi]|uniref:Uncharacterized protein n=1 Tax=Desulfomarina profundi TaxID=2772557 RepID=A0A8D5FFF1_9BACT|nr:hypothetical protein DGMP_02080 [Desulfomarina profundi]